MENGQQEREYLGLIRKTTRRTFEELEVFKMGHTSIATNEIIIIITIYN